MNNFISENYKRIIDFGRNFSKIPTKKMIIIKSSEVIHSKYND